MKTKLTFLIYWVCCISVFAQQKKEISNNQALAKHYFGGDCISVATPCAITQVPTTPARSIAEWEELQAIVVAWDDNQNNSNHFKDNELLAEIIRYAKKECTVIVLTRSPITARLRLLNTYGLEDVDNVQFQPIDTKSIWIRDYGANSAYRNDVDSLVLVDWIYNREHRTEADTAYCALAKTLEIPLYQTAAWESDLIHTGGNYMTDGLGMALSSKLIYEENSADSEFCVSPKTPAEIDEIMYQYLGINRFVTFDTLLYDYIHHVDMHMKLLNEETLLVGAYPKNKGDYDQLEANLAYFQQNNKTSFGTDFKIIRIDMPAGPDGQFPDGTIDFAPYTYTNALFLNKTILVPIYNTPNDEPALELWRSNMPGYIIIGIDCSHIVERFGAIHCITKEIGVAEPLWIAHQQVKSSDEIFEGYPATAIIKHHSGIQHAKIFYKTELDETYDIVPMTALENDNWQAIIPSQPIGTIVYYYIEATANNGKTNVRPLPAPAGYFDFLIDNIFPTPMNGKSIEIGILFPNPTSSLTYLPITAKNKRFANIKIYDVLGRFMIEVHEGELESGVYNYFFDASSLASGAYWMHIQSEDCVATRKFIRK